ncbi:MAG: hypothetical protein GC206_09060 [Alphaproteobacteria bacterium]|nr:hypothetical protein [Alphaproteobacteria bacterium]
MPLDEKIRRVDEVYENISRVVAAVEATPPNGDGLAFDDIDAYLEGVRAFNEAVGRDRPVKILLTHVMPPPRQILEMPSKQIMAHASRTYTFDDVWGRQVNLAVALWRRIVRRYVVDPGEKSVICAFEINNEPDYEWLPDEVRVEKSKNPSAYAVTKYITELHNIQVPAVLSPAMPYEPTPWGGFQDQSGPWLDALPPRPAASVTEFDWGPKFDWYVNCYADLAEHMSYAIWHEARTAGREDIAIVSAGVTHNNIDYLIRMHRANPNAFTYCTAIGLHPYHWPGNNIYDADFKAPYDLSNWRDASPREFAARYFKRFDFFKEAARLTTLEGPPSHGFGGKRLWLTEFGIPSKLPGSYNNANPKFVPYIRPRSWPAEAIPYRSEVWEDLWDAFFDQISQESLAAHSCDAIAFYTLRETAQPRLDKHDDDRSNFALIRRNGSPRLDRETFLRFRDFMGGGDREVTFSEMPIWARGKSFSSELLKSAPWERIDPPAHTVSTVSMLTIDERRFLYWCTSEYFENKGEIVELGPFAGGSSVAFAAGLRDRWSGSGRTIKVYDRFESDSFMDNFYFAPNGLSTINNSFRNIYDAQTAQYTDLLEVHEGDVTQEAWSGAPIEILFIDIAKVWHVNDHVNRTFMPHLIPGKGLVIQQDLFHQHEYWTIITMELLADYFEYIGFVKWNSAVYRCTRPIPLDVIPENLRSLGLERLAALISASIARHEGDPYLRGILKTALIGLYREFGAGAEAAELAAIVAADHPDQPLVMQALKEFGYPVPD